MSLRASAHSSPAARAFPSSFASERSAYGPDDTAGWFRETQICQLFLAAAACIDPRNAEVRYFANSAHDIAIFRNPLHFHGHAWRFSHFSQRGDAFYALGPMGTTIHVRPEDLTHANAAQLLARHVRQTHYWSSMTKPPAQNNRRAIVGGACHPGPHYGPYDALCGSGKGRGVRTTPPITANLSPITNRPLSGSRRAAQARTGPAWTGPGGPPAGPASPEGGGPSRCARH